MAVTENHQFLKLVLESMNTPIRIPKIKYIWFFSCLSTFYSNFSKICWKNKYCAIKTNSSQTQCSINICHSYWCGHWLHYEFWRSVTVHYKLLILNARKFLLLLWNNDLRQMAFAQKRCCCGKTVRCRLHDLMNKGSNPAEVTKISKIFFFFLLIIFTYWILYVEVTR